MRSDGRPDASAEGERAGAKVGASSLQPKPDFSYTTLRDHAFTVTGVRHKGWMLTEPGGTAPVRQRVQDVREALSSTVIDP